MVKVQGWWHLSFVVIKIVTLSGFIMSEPKHMRQSTHFQPRFTSPYIKVSQLMCGLMELYGCWSESWKKDCSKTAGTKYKVTGVILSNRIVLCTRLPNIGSWRGGGHLKKTPQNCQIVSLWLKNAEGEKIFF